MTHIDKTDYFVSIAQTNIEKHRNTIAIAVLNKFGYPNNVERHVSHNGMLEVWIHDNIEIAKMTIEFKKEPNLKYTVKLKCF